jgi:hypothetical protein
MLEVKFKNNAIQIGKHFSVTFQRTLRIPDDGNTYPLPPGLGEFPVCKVQDYENKVPPTWKEHGGVFIPMYQREAMWLGFQGVHWRPNAAKIAIGKINAISGKPWNQKLVANEEDYIVCPTQPWLDGINAGDGYIRQFIAMPLGMGYTVEGQVTGKEEFGGIQIIVFDPKPNKFPDEAPITRSRSISTPLFAMSQPPAAGGAEMGLAAGGKMKQKIYPDEYGVSTWDEENFGRVYVHIVNSMMYREITGMEPALTPITAKMYAQYSLPWFDVYDENKKDIAASNILSQVKSTKDLDQQKGFNSQQDDTPVEIDSQQIKKLKIDPNLLQDGDW